MTTISRRSALRLSLAAACLQAISPAWAGSAAPLRKLGRTDLPEYQGDFDHFAADLKGNRLFLAGEDGGTLEVFDLHSGAHLKTVPQMGTPHAIHFDAPRNRLFISNSGEGGTKVLDGATYAVNRTIALQSGADVMSYDASTRSLWVVTGGKNAQPKQATTTLSRVDPDSGEALLNVTFDTDFTEGVVAEQSGSRLFVNLAGKSEVAVLDKVSGKRLATWPVRGARHNSQIDLDERNGRLFLITRDPFRLVVIDTATGRSVASLAAPPRTNGMMFDAANRRTYAAGDDYVAVFRQIDADHYEEEARIPSEKGAKTAYLVPELRRLYVAVGGSDGAKAGLLRYEVLPRIGG